MKTQVLILGVVVALGATSASWAAPRRAARAEEARLEAQLAAQRLRIQKLKVQMRALSAAPPSSTAAKARPMQTGLTASELKAGRGAPQHVARNAGGLEIWSYGATRVTLMNGRVTTWQETAERAREIPQAAAEGRISPPCIEPETDARRQRALISGSARRASPHRETDRRR